MSKKQRTLKILKKILISLASVLFLLSICYTLAFSTRSGFIFFVDPINDIVDEQSKDHTPKNQKDRALLSQVGAFDYEIYTKEAFSKKYLDQTLTNTQQIIKKLKQTFPATSKNNIPLLYLHFHKTDKTILFTEKDHDHHEPDEYLKTYSKVFLINRYRNIVFVINIWT